MRLWSLHASMLDTKGLVALWREALGAQKALVCLERGEKVGYQSHPQLDRFKASEDPVEYIIAYLWEIHEESLVRGYKFNASKIVCTIDAFPDPLPVSQGQMEYELEWLGSKMEVRSLKDLWRLEELKPMALFEVVPGDIEPWERGVR